MSDQSVDQRGAVVAGEVPILLFTQLRVTGSTALAVGTFCLIGLAAGIRPRRRAGSASSIVRSIYGAWERGDFSSAEWAHLEIEYEHVDGPAPGGTKGLAGMGAFFREVLSTWKEWRGEAEEIRDLDAERVLVFDRFTGGGKTSGLEPGEMWTKGASLFHLSGGKVIRLTQYWSRERALEAVGLRE